MNLRNIREAGFIARFVHIVLLGVIVALGVHYGSRAVIGALTAAWFVIFAVVYLLARRDTHQQHRS